MAVESHAVDPAVHDAASAGTAPYPGQPAPTIPAGTPPADAPKEPAPEPSKDTTPTDVPAEAPKADDAVADAKEAAAAAGLNFDALFEEYQTNGELSKESFDSIVKAYPGLPPEIIQTYLHGLGASMREGQAQVFGEFGGKEVVDSLISWGADNLTPAEIDEYNAAVDRGPQAAIFALRGLQARHRAANPDAPPGEVSLVHEGKPTGGEPPITSRRQLMELQRDPRYAKDPAFRDSVRRKLEAALKNPNYRRD